jgi:hypothetical protein
MPKKLLIFGDNIALDGDEAVVKELLEKLKSDPELEEFISEEGRWLGMGKLHNYAIGIKFTQDNATKSMSLGQSLSYSLINNEPDIADATSTLIGKDIINQFGGPSFIDLLKQARDKIDIYLRSQYEFHHNLVQIVNDTKVFQKAKEIVEAHYTSLFNHDFNQGIKDLGDEFK